MESRETGVRPLWVAGTIVAIVTVFFLVRLPLLTRACAVRGWNGDSAIFGLMAKKIHDGRGFDIFFWGQNYMGPLTPALAALIRRAALDPLGAGTDAGPISLRLASMCELAVGTCLYVLGLLRLFGWPVAVATGVWMAIGPPFFVRLSAVYRSGLGPEMSFVLGSVLFFLAACALTRPRTFLDRAAGLFVVGLVGGLGWWMNQTIVFVLLPVVGLVLFRAWPAWRRIATPLIAGFVLGYAPVWLGRLLGWYEPSSGPYVTPWLLRGLGGRLMSFLGEDCWRFIGLDGLLPAPLLAVAALTLVALFILRRRRLAVGCGSRGLDFVAIIVGFGAAVSFLKGFDSLGDRYLAPVLPAAVALLLVAVQEAARLSRRVPVSLLAIALGGLALAVTLVLGRRARDVVDGILREPDLAAPLETIVAQGYSVCHAGYDMGYTLQFLSDERVRFVPFHSFERNRGLSGELRSLPGPQCLVADDGAVRRWLPSDAAQEGGPARRRAGTVAP